MLIFTGDNTIIIVPGANTTLSSDDVKKAERKIVEADVVLFQFETPIATTIEALKIHQRSRKGMHNSENNSNIWFWFLNFFCLVIGYSIVNGAPAVQNPDEDVYKIASIFCVNESEVSAISCSAMAS